MREYRRGMRRSLAVLLGLGLAAVGCGGEVVSRGDAGRDARASRDLDAAVLDAAAPDEDASAPRDAAPDATSPEPCTTRITYGSGWIHGPDHPAQHDDASGVVTWDGVCVDDGDSSYAELSNGWRPYFAGPSACILALDRRGACEPAPGACTTRLTYGASWQHPAGHPAQHDDVAGVVTWDGECDAAPGGSAALLSNGWAPHFTGAGSCSISVRHEQCGGLFASPVIGVDCPDPGVARDGTEYVLSCTSGGAAAAFPLRTSTDLVHWSDRGHVFPAGSRPGWASGDFWAPELHRLGDGVGERWIVYYSARNAADGRLAVGAATAPSALGPYTDLGRPLVRDPSPGVIDAHHFEAPDGRHFLLYKVDGNAVGRPTPILIQELAADGVTLMGPATTILTNDRAWEGALVEGPWMIARGGSYYLFYSANGYASPSYAIGVARAASPLGPFTKADRPILTSNRAWAGPGHGSVLVGPGGEWVHVYHAWVAGRVGEAPGRLVLVDRIGWSADGWPTMFGSPSPRSQPPP